MFQRLHEFQHEREESVDLLIQVWMRFILSCSSLLLIFIDPTEAGLSNHFVHFLLISYCLYSACLIFLYEMKLFGGISSNRITNRVDMLFFSTLIGLSGGSDSIFFFFYFFAILAASFSWGMREGMRIIFASIVLFTIAGLVYSVLAHKTYDTGEAIIRPIYLLVFGYAIANLGGVRIILKRRLRLLNEIGNLWNPRLGADHVIMASIDNLLQFYRGSRCMIVMHRTGPIPKYIMYERNRFKSGNQVAPKEIVDTTTKELLILPNYLAVGYKSKKSDRFLNYDGYFAYNVTTAEPSDDYYSESATLSNLLDGESFISVPYQQQGMPSGRLYFIPGNRIFNRADIIFIKQVADAMASVIDNVLLVDNLIAEAEGHERQRISLDVHDTTIQPYIGLTLALDALSRQVKSTDQLTEGIREIINMANMTINDLRSYKDTLREKSVMRGDFLISAVNLQVERMQRFYGIKIEVDGTVDPNLPGRIAEAAFQIVREGLSNILRHTVAKNGFIRIKSIATQLLIEIGNEPNDLSNSSGSSNPNQTLFKPKSITERVSTLKGSTMVEFDRNRYTIVRVTIPLSGY